MGRGQDFRDASSGGYGHPDERRRGREWDGGKWREVRHIRR